MKNLSQLIRSTRQKLHSAGISDHNLEAELIWMSALDIDKAHLYLAFDEYPENSSIKRAEKLISTRLKREPLAYLLGRKEFYGRDFFIHPGVLIPRHDTETLVEEAVRFLENNYSNDTKIIDVGCGSGIIGISIAIRFPSLDIIAIDSDPLACSLTKSNAKKNGVSNQLSVIQADLLTAVRGSSDLIVANLPYIPSLEIEFLEPEVRLFEPQVALDGGGDGFTVIRRMLNQTRDLIKPKGALLMEIDPNQAEIALAEIAEIYPHSDCAIIKDISGLDRVVVCKFTSL